MLRNIFILIVLYLIFTMEFSCFKSFDSTCMNSVQDRLSGIFRWIIDIVDSFFESDYWKSLDKEKSIVGNLLEKK